MQILKRIGIILVWLAGPVFIFAAVNKNDPYLIALRGRNIVLAAASIIAVVVLIRRGYWRQASPDGCSFCCGACHRCRCLARMLRLNGASECLQTDAAGAALGGTSSLDTRHSRRWLFWPREGLIFGVYVTRHNVAGSTAARLKRDLGAARKAASGRPATPDRRCRPGRRHRIASGAALTVAALSTLRTAPDVRAEAEAFGRVTGRSWRRLAST
jgi:beta-N-acetylhexosaminidase